MQASLLKHGKSAIHGSRRLSPILNCDTKIRMTRMSSDSSSGFPEYGNRVLRVATNTKVAPWRVVSVFFDRTMKNKL